MKSPQRIFADLTALLEDLHSIAVDGQAPDGTPTLQRLQAHEAEAGLARGCRLLVVLRRSIQRVSK